MTKIRTLKLLLPGILAVFLACSKAPYENQSKNLNVQELESISQEMSEVLQYFPVDSVRIPRSLGNEELNGVKSKDWTSGFFPGILWYLYEYSEDNKFLEAARIWTSFIEKEKFDSATHDTGFKIYCSFGNGYRLTGDESYKDIIVRASATLLSRYNENVKCIRSWDFNKKNWKFPVIIDNMMNLEMLFAATRLTGDSSYYRVAYNHALTTLENHFRADFSSYHVIDYNPDTGKIRKRETHQGSNHESAWSRGQAWGLYGFTVAYRETKNPAFLQHARRIAEFMLDHPNLPSDKIPYWDFDAPDIPNEERDVSAAAIMASALYELSTYLDDAVQQKYENVADHILKVLGSSAYRRTNSRQPFLLNHSVGSKPGRTEVDVPIIYADYYYIEALLRKKRLM